MTTFHKALIAYSLFGLIMGSRLVFLARTTTQRWVTVIVGGPIIWAMFIYNFVKEFWKNIKKEMGK